MPKEVEQPKLIQCIHCDKIFTRMDDCIEHEKKCLHVADVKKYEGRCYYRNHGDGNVIAKVLEAKCGMLYLERIHYTSSSGMIVQKEHLDFMPWDDDEEISLEKYIELKCEQFRKYCPELEVKQ